MTAVQYDLFNQIPKAHGPDYYWQACWGWAGPEVGGNCEVGSTCVKTEAGHVVYAYMLRVHLIEQRGEEWIAEVDTPGIEWKHGRLVLMKADIWPSTRDLRKKRKA